MDDKELLLQEIKQEAETLKVMAQNEFKALADKLSNIFLSDFVPFIAPADTASLALRDMQRYMNIPNI